MHASTHLQVDYRKVAAARLVLLPARLGALLLLGARRAVEPNRHGDEEERLQEGVLGDG